MLSWIVYDVLNVVVMCRAAEIFDDPEGADLIREYAEECGNALVGTPVPQRDRYENLEAAGMGQCFAAYVGLKLVGFAFVLVTAVPHYDVKLAAVESVFVTRSAHCGAVLMTKLNDYAASMGCATIFYTAPVGSRLAKLLFLCSDEYTHTSHVFSRRLI